MILLWWPPVWRGLPASDGPFQRCAAPLHLFLPTALLHRLLVSYIHLRIRKYTRQVATANSESINEFINHRTASLWNKEMMTGTVICIHFVLLWKNFVHVHWLSFILHDVWHLRVLVENMEWKQREREQKEEQRAAMVKVSTGDGTATLLLHDSAEHWGTVCASAIGPPHLT